MPLIKRYPNRKLCDTEAKKYITLEGISELIRNGEEVQVIDHTTEEDLTALPLTQIIFEQEKKKAASSPPPSSPAWFCLRGRNPQLPAPQPHLPAGIVHPCRRGNRYPPARAGRTRRNGKEDASKLRAKLLSDAFRLSPSKNETGKEAADEIDLGAIEQAVRARGIPTKEDVNTLVDQLDALTQKIDALSQEIKPPAP
ncbi:MAG: hypothetical protein M5U34_19860 [Chloroflexi bacterium]|nr:hypothetical protein [Chloroflexota bacterium]